MFEMNASVNLTVYTENSYQFKKTSDWFSDRIPDAKFLRPNYDLSPCPNNLLGDNCSSSARHNKW
jgi:hypothetical protein